MPETVLKFSFSLIVCFILSTSKAQDSTSKREPITAGLSFTKNYTTPYLIKSDWNRLSSVNYNDSLDNIEARGQLSSGFGILLNLPLTNRFNIRIGANYLTREFDIKYHRKNGITEIAMIEMEYMSFPLICSFDYFKNDRYNLNVNSGGRMIKNVSPDKLDNPWDFAVDFGLGFERSFYKDILASNFIGLELKYSYGFKDIITRRFNIYTFTIEKLTLGTAEVTIYIRC